MNQLTNYKHKIDFLVSNDTSLTKCNECKKRKPLDESRQICYVCYSTKKIFKSSGNKVIDDFIRYTQINLDFKEGKMEFVPYEQFKSIQVAL